MSDGNDATAPGASDSPRASVPVSHPAAETGVRLLRRPLSAAEPEVQRGLWHPQSAPAPPRQAAQKQPSAAAGSLTFTSGGRVEGGDYSVRAEWHGFQCTGTGRSAKAATLRATQGILAAVAQGSAGPAAPTQGGCMCPMQPPAAQGEEDKLCKAQRAELDALSRAHREELDALRRAQREEASELVRVHRAEIGTLRRVLGADASAHQTPGPSYMGQARVTSSGPRGRRVHTRSLPGPA